MNKVSEVGKSRDECFSFPTLLVFRSGLWGMKISIYYASWFSSNFVLREGNCFCCSCCLKGTEYPRAAALGIINTCTESQTMNVFYPLSVGIANSDSVASKDLN